SASADSRPGNVSAVTSCPSARRAAATSSHAHAPSQNPGTRMIGAEAMRRPYGPEGTVAIPLRVPPAKAPTGVMRPDTLPDRERRQPDGNLVRFGEGRAALVPGHPGNDQAAGRGERRALRVDRIPLSASRLATASHPSAGRELHRAGGTADGAGRRAAVRARPGRGGPGSDGGRAHVPR